MSSLNNFWIQYYGYTYNHWFRDSITQEYVDLIFVNNNSLISFVINSSFINQHILIDSLNKLSYIDSILVDSNVKSYSLNHKLYSAFVYDTSLDSNISSLYTSFLFQSEYQDPIHTLIIIAPELTTLINEYIYTYVIPSSFSLLPAAVFDSYLSNWSFYTGLGLINIFLFIIFVWIIVYFLLSDILLRWVLPVNFQFIRFYYYVYSMSKEIRIQLEVMSQTILFFSLYWITTLMTFDDNQEEVIEFIDTGYFYFFILITIYICFKYSIHYFSFLEASVAEGRSVKFITTQVFKDFLNTFSLLLRFYILLLRVNVYDTLDDFLDSYYIFIGDFDEDEYLNEVFISIYGSVLFLSENDYDTSFLLEDEHDFFNDWFYLYFVVWGKLFYFTFFMLEEAARLSLAFYVCYLIIFEVHSANCSYKEDTFLSNKRNI